MSHHQHQWSSSQNAQERKYQRSAWMRKAKRWLKKSMIVIIILLVIAIILSYIFITKEPEPQEIEVRKSLLVY